MATFATFEREIRIASAGLGQKEISAELARFAKAEVARLIASGQASPYYDRYVNGRAGLPEEAVVAPGPIVYVFANWGVINREALAALIKNSPRKTGAFQSSFLVIASGKPVTDFDKIGPDEEVIITNFQPYVRKIQVGAMEMSVPPKVFDKARRALFSRFGQQLISAQVMFLNLPAGLHPQIPYILKGRQKMRAASPSRQSSAFRDGRTTLSRRRDTEAGKPLTYPSLVLNMAD